LRANKLHDVPLSTLSDDISRGDKKANDKGASRFREQWGDDAAVDAANARRINDNKTSCKVARSQCAVQTGWLNPSRDIAVTNDSLEKHSEHTGNRARGRMLSYFLTPFYEISVTQNVGFRLNHELCKSIGSNVDSSLRI